jgi:hypothetical protein
VPPVERFGRFYQPVGNRCIGSNLWVMWHAMGPMSLG